jgi:xanthine dehydrogenase accessory factor
MNKELELWLLVASLLKQNQSVMLLTVATSSGSSPGRPGYKMAVAEDGRLAGSIGGGVMEVNLVEQSRAILSESRRVGTGDGLTPAIREQVHRKNVPNSSGMICSGKQTVVFKLLTPDDAIPVREVIAGIKKRDGSILNIDPKTFEVRPAEAGTQNIDFEFARRSDTDFEYRERLGAKNDLIIIGGGHCAFALSELMSKMDFYIRLFDDRPQLNTIEKNKFADEINLVESYERIGDHIESNRRAYVVVMTLGYKTDKIVMQQLIDKDFKYFGVLGSEAKMATVLRDLENEGLDKKSLDRIRTPIGLPINSHSPEEIAVSIAAEIIAVKNGANI